MNAKRLVLIGLCAGLLGFSVSGRADDIDIYAGLGTSANTPNVLFVMDNSANFSATSGGVTCKLQADGSLKINAVTGTDTAMSGTVGGIEQCALWNVVKNLPVNADGTARISIGFMVYNGPNIHDVNNANCGGSLGGCLTQPMIAMTTDNKTGVLNWIAAWNMSPSASFGNVKAAGKATAATVQEAWAYFSGKTGLSGRSYAAIQPPVGCQKNFLIYVGNAYSSASTPGDASSGDPLTNSPNGLTATINAQPKPASLTDAQWAALKTVWKTPILNQVNTACLPAPGTYNFATPSSNHTESGGHYADEWTRFMNQADAYTTTPDGIQNITTYTVGLLDPASCKEEHAALLDNMATKGGGKYFAATTYESMVNSIMKILNEVQAVNSVFSSSSLPVSVNAQGTFLNQIYMGMFRPDSGALPRWPGNLKQYQFIINPTTGALQLGDSLSNQALDSSGTGFLSPNAISFWSCATLATNPYVNSGMLTAAQIALLGQNNQNCVDPVGGFWKNDPGSANAVAGGYDLPDGERVERGGTAQQIRHAILETNYTTSPAAPRKMYTWCPAGTGCVNNLTDASNAFATTNTNLVATAFGSTLTANISSLTRSGSTVTVATSGNHGFTTGDSITIANASPNDYNGTFTISVVDATHFTYPIIEYPPAPAVGSFTATVSGTPVSVSALSRSGNTVSVTTAAAHGLIVGDAVIIAGATPTDYNGSFLVVSTPSATSFTYALNERPATVGGAGTASSVTKTVGAGCPCSTTVNINAWNAATPGIQRTLGFTTVTVNTDTNLSKYLVGNTVTMSGVKDSSGTLVPEYNGSFIITGVSGNSFTFSTTLSPTSPASGTITASPSTTTLNITNMTRTGSTARATMADTAALGGAGASVSIGGTAGANEDAYLGSHIISNVTATTFDFPVVTTPASPATGVGGATMTATRSSGLDATNLSDLINWVRGLDNQGDEYGPGSPVTVRPSVHGDVLHSRPTVINYGSYPVAITATSDSGTVRTATASVSDVATIASFGAAPIVTFANGQACPVTVATATTFTYQNTSCGAAGAQATSTGSKVVVFYGDNGGVFHAVNGNQTAMFGSVGPGDELWGFVPKEFFPKLNRLRTNSPQLNLPSTPPGISPQPRIKDYFVDGSPGIYQQIDAAGNTTRAVIYLAMRRGGNFIYALDVTDPATPTVLWKVDNSSPGMSELGQTWSQPKVARVKGYAGPVLIFGGGYDTNEDNEPPTANVSGRGIYVLDALTGAVVWSATHSAGATSCSGNTIQATCVVSGMNYGIPADVTLVDRTFDGYIDRLYAADVGGNIWRVDLEPVANATPDLWRVRHFAALGCWTSACSIPTTTTQRKFFYPPEVITATAAYPYDSVIAGSGDREHPLYVSTTTQRYNRVFLLKDVYTGNDASGMTTPITMAGTLPLFDATSTPWNGTLNGYYITLAAGEKVVNAPLVTAGYVYFGTNQPAAPSTTSCTSNLGTAKGYQLSPFTGAYTSSVFSGGGLPPSPVAGIVNVIVGGVVKQVPFLIGGGGGSGIGACTGSDCGSALGGQKPPINVSTKRTRTYWYIEKK